MKRFSRTTLLLLRSIQAPIFVSSFIAVPPCYESFSSISKSHLRHPVANKPSSTRTSLFAEKEAISSGRVLSLEYFKSVYEYERTEKEEGDMIETTQPTSTTPTTPWDIGGGRPQPAIIRAYKEGQLRGRILDAGCGAGENCIYLADKYGVTEVVGSDIAEGAIREAKDRLSRMKEKEDNVTSGPFWTEPTFFAASCTELFDRYQEFISGNGNEEIGTDDAEESNLFDVSIDSGLLHCLSDSDAELYIKQLGRLVKPKTGRAYVGCFSTKNPAESWDNPRRLSPSYLMNLFSEGNGWEIVSITDTWWARPPQRGSSQGSFSMALWMEARRK